MFGTQEEREAKKKNTSLEREVVFWRDVVDAVGTYFMSIIPQKNKSASIGGEPRTASCFGTRYGVSVVSVYNG
jgi:hypothetical protein